MSILRRIAATAPLLVGPLACFSDGGLHPTGTGASTSTGDGTTAGDGSGSSGGTSTTDGTTGPEPTTTGTTAVPSICGDGVVDPGEACDDGNNDGSDGCSAACELEACGDGVVQVGEACDDGAANDPYDPAACRPNCQKPACGDGALYLGPLGPELEIDDAGNLLQSPDNPRAIGVDAEGTFSVVYRDPGSYDRVEVQTVSPDGVLDGAPINYADLLSAEITRPVIAVAPIGDLALAWSVPANNGDIVVRGVVAGVAEPGFVAVANKNSLQRSPTVALDDLGGLTLAYVGVAGLNLFHVYARRIDNFDPGSPPEFIVSEHRSGVPSPPSVAHLADGGFVIAWGDPDGAIVYRRYSAGAEPGPRVTTALRPGGVVGDLDASAWTGLAALPDLGVVIGGVGDDGLVDLQRFDAADVAQAPVPASEAPRLHAPFIDLATDAAGNLAVAWAECGDPDEDAPDCDSVASELRLRWFRPDLTPYAASTAVYATMLGAPPPIGVAVAPTGVTGVTYLSGARVVARVAPLQCPAP